MKITNSCQLCGLPFEAAISVMPLVTGAIAGTAVGCSGKKCSTDQKVVRGLAAGVLTALATTAVEAMKERVCKCHKRDDDGCR